MKEKDLTGYCGLYCGDCIRYQSKSSDLADRLLKELDRQRFSEYADVKRRFNKDFDNYDLLISGLKAIAGLRCEIPCRLGGNGCAGSCEIIMCVKTKSLEGCWGCDTFETCDKFNFLKPFHGDGPMNNLKKIKKYGLGNWATHREKFYPWL